jgi:hypothetical protein
MSRLANLSGFHPAKRKFNRMIISDESFVVPAKTLIGMLRILVQSAEMLVSALLQILTLHIDTT